MHESDKTCNYPEGPKQTANTAGDEAPALARDLLALAGVKINGPSAWDIQVRDPHFYSRVLRHGSLGFGEAFMDGQWDCKALDQLMTRLLAADVEQHFTGLARLRILLEMARHQLFNLQSRERSFQVGEEHYDLGNDVFEVMLDPAMIYSCAFWQNATTLEQAQRDKLDLICRKLELKPGEHLLDIGCGWGGLAHYAASHYQVKVTGITVSREQQALAQERCRGLPVDIQLTDYRELQGTYDKIVSVGMFEHVGRKNYAVYFDTAQRLLDDQGLFLLHTIGSHRTIKYADPWIDKYIFPNGKLPSAEEIAQTLNGRFLIEDWHNFGRDYDRTLMAWWNNFERAWPQLQARYPVRFYRMWKYYLLSCAGFFRARHGQLWQLVLTHQQRQPMYRSVR